MTKKTNAKAKAIKKTATTKPSAPTIEQTPIEKEIEAILMFSYRPFIQRIWFEAKTCQSKDLTKEEIETIRTTLGFPDTKLYAFTDSPLEKVKSKLKAMDAALYHA